MSMFMTFLSTTRDCAAVSSFSTTLCDDVDDFSVPFARTVYYEDGLLSPGHHRVRSSRNPSRFYTPLQKPSPWTHKSHICSIAFWFMVLMGSQRHPTSTLLIILFLFYSLLFAYRKAGCGSYFHSVFLQLAYFYPTLFPTSFSCPMPSSSVFPRLSILISNVLYLFLFFFLDIHPHHCSFLLFLKSRTLGLPLQTSFVLFSYFSPSSILHTPSQLLFFILYLFPAYLPLIILTLVVVVDVIHCLL